MFRKLYNRALFEGVIEPDGPLMIVQGGLALDPAAPDLAFVRTRLRGQETVYLRESEHLRQLPSCLGKVQQPGGIRGDEFFGQQKAKKGPQR